MKLSENPNVKILIDNAFNLGKEQAEREFRELIDSLIKKNKKKNLGFLGEPFLKGLKNQIGGNGE